MWKIAIAVMLLASSAFAAADLTIESPQAKPGDASTLVYGADRQITLNFTMVPTDGSMINGLTIASGGTTPGTLLVTSRVYPNVTLNTPLSTNAPGALIETYGDLGVRSGVTSQGVGVSAPVLTMVLTVAPGVQTTTLVLSGYWATPDFDEGEIAPQTFSIVPTPEPASMLLLAAGAAFFARRRRA